MTTSVKVSAHCAPDIQVRISQSGEGIDPVDALIQNGETYEQVVHGGMSVSVKEEAKPTQPAHAPK